MAYRGTVRRWDIYWADLEPHVGSEQGGEGRPAVVVSNDGFNEHFDVITVLPVTKLEGKERKPYTFEVVLPKGVITREWSSIAMPLQVRTISKLRLLELIGRPDDEALQVEIENRLLEHFGIAFEAEELDEGE